MMLASYIAAGATSGLSTPNPTVECECPTEHTVAKLGHSRACPWFEAPLSLATVCGSPVIVLVCNGEHRDGAPHDFEWATYADDTVSTGVCRCGMWASHHALWSAR